ncbi:MAG: aminoglycoside phosphotransferase family protein [Heyndrickxia sp.]
MNISESFKHKIVCAFGEKGKEWLETIETRVQISVEKWNLNILGPVTNLSYNYVLRALDAQGNPVILKLGVPGFDFQNEIRTLEAYEGKGCASLIEADTSLGAILQKELVPGTMLDKEDEITSVYHYVKVWKAIRRPLPPGLQFPSIEDWSSGLERYQNNFPLEDGPISATDIQLARDYFAFITNTSAGPVLLHGDLHHENILYSKEIGWTAIDPKGVSGDPYFDITSFLINHLHERENPKELLRQRIDMLSKELGLERERLLKASIAMSTLYAVWGIEDADAEWENTYKCAKWMQELL